MNVFRKLFRYVLLGLVLQQAGGMLNVFVVDNNDGMMPVWVFDRGIELSMADDQEHTRLTKDSKDVILADIIPIPAISKHRVVVDDMMSLGDLALFAGYSLFVISSLILIAYLFMWLLGLFFISSVVVVFYLLSLLLVWRNWKSR